MNALWMKLVILCMVGKSAGEAFDHMATRQFLNIALFAVARPYTTDQHHLHISTDMIQPYLVIANNKLSDHCRDSYVSVLIFHPFYLPPDCLTVIPSLQTLFLVAKTGLGLYRTMLSMSGLLGLHC